MSAARSLYSAVLGLEIVEEQSALFVGLGGQRIRAITTLPERAKVQGAPSHWLGQLAVRSVEECVAEFVKRGGSQLGPLQFAKLLRNPARIAAGIEQLRPVLEVHGVVVIPAPAPDEALGLERIDDHLRHAVLPQKSL